MTATETDLLVFENDDPQVQLQNRTHFMNTLAGYQEQGLVNYHDTTLGFQTAQRERYLTDLTAAAQELDIFDDANKGIIIAEVEFRSEDAVANFTKPAWLGNDGTEGEKYKNASLAK